MMREVPSYQPPANEIGEKNLLERLAERVNDITEREISGANLEAKLDSLHKSVRVPRVEADSLLEDSREKMKQLAVEENTARQIATISFADRLRKFGERNKVLFGAFIAAGALHLPLSDTVRNVTNLKDAIANELKNPKSPWERPNMVVHTQSDEETEQVRSAVDQRLRRTNPADIAAYKQDVREKLERGENIRFDELYFNLEIKNGVPAEDVERAKLRATEIAEAEWEKAGHQLTEATLRSQVASMYALGPHHDAQASVSKYFNTGVHSCVSFGKGMLIILEKEIAKLPADQQINYELGLKKMKNHEIATITIRSPGGKEVVYDLEPGLRNTSINEPGTAHVSLAMLKAAMVSPVVFRVNANGAPSEVADSPEIILVNDQPVGDGVEVTGKLTISDFRIQQLQREELIPEEKPFVPTPDVLQVEILHEPPMEGVIAAQKIIDDEIEAITIMGDDSEAYPPPIDISTWKNPSVEAIQALTLPATFQSRAGELISGSMKGWSKEAMVEVINSEHKKVVFWTINGRLPQNFFEALKLEKDPSKLRIKEIALADYVGADEKNIPPMPAHELRALLEAFRGLERIELNLYSMDDERAKLIADLAQKRIDLIGHNFSRSHIAQLNTGKASIYLNPSSLSEYSNNYRADVFHAKKIFFNIEDMTDGKEINNALQAYQTLAPERTDMIAALQRKLKALKDGTQPWTVTVHSVPTKP